MKKSKNLSPLFCDCKILEENNVEIRELDPNNQKKGKLYICKLRIYNYYNPSGKLIKQLKIVKEKIFKTDISNSVWSGCTII